jgi:hypothetical protein
MAFHVVAILGSMSCLMLVPLTSRFEEMVKQFATFKSTNIGEEIVEYVGPKSPYKLSQC